MTALVTIAPTHSGRALASVPMRVMYARTNRSSAVAHGTSMSAATSEAWRCVSSETFELIAWTSGIRAAKSSGEEVGEEEKWETSSL